MSQFGLPAPATIPVAQSESLGSWRWDAQPLPQTPARLVCPFRLGLDHMERLLVVGLKGDPEFTAIEPQVFDDTQNGRGMRILRYRRDGRVDVYHEPGVRLNRDHYTFGEGIADLCETAISPARFEIGPDGLRLDIAFSDADGRPNALCIVEGGPSRGFPMLAPVGADIGKPRMLFLVLMRSIALLRRQGTVFTGQIGARTLKPAGLPLPLCGAWVWFTRYSDRLVIATLNPPAMVPVVETAAQATGPGSKDRIVLDRAGDIVRLVAGVPGHGAAMGFCPSLPEPRDIAIGAEGRGALEPLDLRQRDHRRRLFGPARGRIGGGAIASDSPLAPWASAARDARPRTGRSAFTDMAHDLRVVRPGGPRPQAKDEGGVVAPCSRVTTLIRPNRPTVTSGPLHRGRTIRGTRVSAPTPRTLPWAVPSGRREPENNEQGHFACHSRKDGATGRPCARSAWMRPNRF